MRRRNFLQALLAGALGALGHRIPAHAQSPTASRLAEGQPSATAQFTASLRAAHQLVDHPRIFDDPLALRIIGAQAEAAVRARAGKSRMAWLRPFVAVRSRYAEDSRTAIPIPARSSACSRSTTLRRRRGSRAVSRTPASRFLNLTRNAAIDTLKVVASLPPGTEIVFDYAIPPATLGEEDRARHDDAAPITSEDQYKR